MKRSGRLEILDIYRFIAILLVMLFHYFSRWIPPYSNLNLYPYTNRYDFFFWGRMGVHFFFMISGFVIYMTLERSAGIINFAKKRIIRLLPSMVLISSITYLVFIVFDKNFIFTQSHSLKNLFYSWTFLGSGLFRSNFSHIDGSYWSLWVEVQFYALAAMVYYAVGSIRQEQFFLYAFVLLGLGLEFFHNYSFMQKASRIFNLLQFFNFFIFGLIFKKLYDLPRTFDKKSVILHIMIVAVLGYELRVFSDDRITKLLTILFVLLFYVFIYIAKTGYTFKSNYIKKIIVLGQASYISYLLHQNIGVFIIHQINYSGRFSFIVPVIVIFLIFWISYLLYKVYELPVLNLLKRKAIN